MSGFYIGVDGKARKVKGGYIGIDGVARKIKKGYIGDENGVARLCWSGEFDPVFANNSWEEIAIACQNGNVPDTWAVGDQKTMTIDGVDYAIDIIGKNHDDYSDGSGKAPLTFQMHDLYSTAYPMNEYNTNIGGWAECKMRSIILPTVLLLMPNNVQTAIKQVKKITTIGESQSATVATADKLFLLSEIETFGTRRNSANTEGVRYKYYSSGNSLVKHLNGKAQYYWSRSPYYNNAAGFVRVESDGDSDFGSATNNHAIAFAFCF